MTRLVLFFTHDVSLKIWQERGLYDREIKPYQILAADGYEITFVTYGDDVDLTFAQDLEPIRVLPAYAGSKIPKNKILSLILSPLVLWKYRKELRQADIFKTNQFWGGWNAVFAKWLFRGKLLARCGYEYLQFIRAENHSRARQFLAYIVDWLVYRFADHIVMASPDDALFAQNTFRFLHNKTIEIQPNWIDTAHFKPHAASGPLQADLVFIGRLSRQKNLKALIEASASAGSSLDIYGDGECREELMDLAADLNAPARFKGRIPNFKVPEVLARYKLFILPSLFEGNPKALLEAMACEIPVIGTNAPGIHTIIRDGKTGLLSDTDSTALAACIRKALAHPDRMKKMAKKARQSVLEQNSLEEFIRREKERLSLLYGSRDNG